VVEVALLFCRVRLNGKKPPDKAYPAEVKTLGGAIRKRRLDFGLRQIDVATIIDCNQMSVLNWEKGHTQPQINKMAGIKRFLTKGLVFGETRCASQTDPNQLWENDGLRG
jgi:DNA-binding XRE family transcriptional regulator